VRRYAVVTAAVVVLAGAFAVAGVALRGGKHHRSRPDVAGAFFHGGVPMYDPALERVLGDALADVVIDTASDRHGSGADPLRLRRLADLADSPAVTARSPALADAWRELLASLDRWVGMPIHSKGYVDAERDLRERASAVSDELAALGLGYYLKADVMVSKGAAHAAVFAYRVERIEFVRVGLESQRVLQLRRLDRLNLTHAVLGMQSDDLGDPVVLLDQIDEFIASHVTPVLVGGDYPLDDARLASAAGDAIRRELSGRDAKEIERFVIATVRRHEARHHYDVDATPLREPAPLAAYIGNDAKSQFVQRARAELAAYLSQIANDPVTPQLALWNLTSQALHGQRWGNAEAYVAVVVIEGLARSTHGPVVHGGSLDRARLAQLALPLANLTDEDLRAAARGLWSDLYGSPCERMVDPW
jgi:hypothetical protein